MAARNLLDRDGLLGKINHTNDWWMRHRKQLEADGFPKPVPGMGDRYDPEAIDAWLDRFIPPQTIIGNHPRFEVYEQDGKLHSRLAAAAESIASD